VKEACSPRGFSSCCRRRRYVSIGRLDMFADRHHRLAARREGAGAREPRPSEVLEGPIMRCPDELQRRASINRDARRLRRSTLAGRWISHTADNRLPALTVTAGGLRLVKTYLSPSSSLSMPSPRVGGIMSWPMFVCLCVC